MIFFNIIKSLFISYLIKLGLYDEKLIKVLLKNIYRCGVIPVKMIQWFLPPLKVMDTDKKLLNILENTYEKCPLHDLKHTLDLYKQDFYTEFDDSYEILDIIGSGSIAQVYKIKDKRTDIIYAMKVKHPNVLKDYNIIKRYLKCIFLFIPFNKIVPISINDFFDQFEQQINFVNEGNNMIKFYNEYENNNLYKIPKLFKLSENILIMEYIKGNSIENMELSNIEYSKYNLMIYIFIQHNLIMNNFNHGDLHNYNWKVTEDKKIVIYDFGLCWKLFNHSIIIIMDFLIEGFHYKNYDKLYDTFYKFIRLDSNIDEYIIKEYFDLKMKNKLYRFMDFFKHLLLFCLEKNILLNINILYIIISWQNTLLIFMNNFEEKEEFVVNEMYMEEYNICDYYDIFHGYQEYLKKQMDKYERKNTFDINILNKFIK
jgi:predicted unusual protein kinase regulating ubiquinone biosynthesis (AarF/ABC1/UbiB family)